MTKKKMTRKEFMEMPADERMRLCLSDGTWWNAVKLAKQTRETPEDCKKWLQHNARTFELINSGDAYRMDYDHVVDYYASRGLDINHQLAKFLYVPRLWNNMTEVEALLEAPRREVDIVMWKSSPEEAAKVRTALRGIAPVHENAKGEYMAIGLSGVLIKKIAEDLLPTNIRVRIQKMVLRRSLVDLSEEFITPMLQFYIQFGFALTRHAWTTMDMFLPTREEKESQMLLWVIRALEKFDEKATVPFSGYLASALRFWPYDLPAYAVGPKVAAYQRKRIKLVRKYGEAFTSAQAAEFMDISEEEAIELEHIHKTWKSLRHPDTLASGPSLPDDRPSVEPVAKTSNIVETLELSSKLARTVVKAAKHESGIYALQGLGEIVGSSNPTEFDVKSVRPSYLRSFAREWEKIKHEDD